MRKYLTTEDKKDIDKYIKRIISHMSDLQNITIGFIDSDDDFYKYEYKDYARIDDKLNLMRMELHYLQGVFEK